MSHDSFDIDELVAKDLPTAKPEDFLDIHASDESMPKEEFDRLMGKVTEYFSRFVHAEQQENPNLITGGVDCIGCGRHLNGFLGTFTWGIAYGHGFCSSCGYPYVAIHRILDDDKEPILQINNMLLAVHPRLVKEKMSDNDPAHVTTP